MTDDRPAAHDVADLGLHLGLDDATLDRKLAALAAVPSQTAGIATVVPPDDYRERNRVESFIVP